jgi:DNA primase
MARCQVDPMRIRQEDVEHVRASVRIEEVVGEHVTLRPAGVGSQKGLCPFHDERTPSFHVRPQVGRWHCFGCGEGGDVIDFVQKIDHLQFTEAVERLAARIGFQLRYEDGAGPGRRDQLGGRQRLVEANRVAEQFYARELAEAPEAMIGRQFLTERGFDRDAAAHFGVGFAPRQGEALLRHLRGKGFTEEELLGSGLAGRGSRGVYDRFRGRLVWPIRDVVGDVVGFGARRLADDDPIQAKYLNTPETALYKKSQVLYGVDLAKREIARNRQVVVVEGYTDVMACHLAGVGTAVATCGTAFGAEHARVVRRLLGDDAAGGQVVFTFDGDEAGQKAALRAFEEDQRFVAQTYIAVAEGGMDPCELRQRHGDEAVRELVAARTPLFEFAIRATIRRYDLDTAEGRVQALRAAAPVVARIRDPALRPEYARQLAGWLGMEVEAVQQAVRQASARATHRARAGAADRAPDGQAAAPAGEPGQQGQPGSTPPDQRSVGRPGRAKPADPVIRTEREALECILQVPHLLPAAEVDALAPEAFTLPAHRAIFDAVRASGGVAAAAGMGSAAWVRQVREQAPEALGGLVSELSVAPLPEDRDDRLAGYATAVVLRMAELAEASRIIDLRARVQRLSAEEDGYQEAFAELLAAETRRRSLRERITGG